MRGQAGGLHRDAEREKVKPKPGLPQGQQCHFSSSPLRSRQPLLSLSPGCAPPVRHASLSGKGLGEGRGSQWEKGSLHALRQAPCSCQNPWPPPSPPPILSLPPPASHGAPTQASGGAQGWKVTTTPSVLQGKRDSMARRATVLSFL